MRPSEDLSRFVREALAQGRTRGEVAAALTGAGWTPVEVEGALAAWGEVPGLPPVPRPRSSVSAREGFRYGLLFVALAVVAGHLVALAFDIIEAFVPDLADTDPVSFDAGWRRSSMRWSIAALVVFTPLLLWLSARIEREAARNPGQRRSGVRQWLAYVALLAVAVCLLGDLLVTVYALLSGDLTARFVLKALTVAVIASASFAFVRAIAREASFHAG